MEIEITREKGGMREFEKTGIYPSYIRFYLKEYKRTWRFKLRSDPQVGKLKFKGNVIYEYECSDETCKIRAIEKDKSFGDWHFVEDAMIIMVD